MVNLDTNTEVEFQFFRPTARNVFLVGDFNGWNQTSLPMQRSEGGFWTYRLGLAPGSYQFKYLADGEWHLDYAAFGLEPGGMGAWNSVLLVEAGVMQQRSGPKPEMGNMVASRPETSSHTLRRANRSYEFQEA